METALDWANYKFTDRDVRDHSDLTEIARTYLIQYTGDFEFLLEMRQRCERLTVPQARGVLNCMRNDPRASAVLMEIIKRLPRNPTVPALPVANGDGDFKKEKVVSIRRGRLYQRTNEQCADETPHYGHWTDDNNWCKGVPYEINRSYVIVSAKVKRKYAVAKSGKLIHLVAKAGHHTIWYPKCSHAYGFGEHHVSVKLVCRYPGALQDPVLMDELPENPWGLKLCPHCIKEARTWLEMQSSNESESTSPSSPVEETSGVSAASPSRTVPPLVFMQPSAVPSE